jgi:hypothetical protein
MFPCEHCNKEFKTQRNLRNHQETAKSCLKQRNADPEVLYLCFYCEKNFSTDQNRNRHYKTCIKKYIAEIDRLTTIIEENGLGDLL